MVVITWMNIHFSLHQNIIILSWLNRCCVYEVFILPMLYVWVCAMWILFSLPSFHFCDFFWLTFSISVCKCAFIFMILLWNLHRHQHDSHINKFINNAHTYELRAKNHMFRFHFKPFYDQKWNHKIPNRIQFFLCDFFSPPKYIYKNIPSSWQCFYECFPTFFTSSSEHSQENFLFDFLSFSSFVQI